jgi:hypothetical protein
LSPVAINALLSSFLSFLVAASVGLDALLEFERGFQAGVDLGHKVPGEDPDALVNKPLLDGVDVSADHGGVLTKPG